MQNRNTSGSNSSNTNVVCCLSPSEIEEGNYLISKFMEWEDNSDDDGLYNYQTIDAYYTLKTRYHSSWDWLIPSVEKIYKMYKWDKFYYSPVVCHFYLSENIKILTGKVNDNETDEGFCGKMKYIYKPCQPKYAVWLAVVEFIKWYNQNETAKR